MTHFFSLPVSSSFFAITFKLERFTHQNQVHGNIVELTSNFVLNLLKICGRQTDNFVVIKCDCVCICLKDNRKENNGHLCLFICLLARTLSSIDVVCLPPPSSSSSSAILSSHSLSSTKCTELSRKDRLWCGWLVGWLDAWLRRRDPPHCWGRACASHHHFA